MQSSSDQPPPRSIEIVIIDCLLNRRSQKHTPFAKLMSALMDALDAGDYILALKISGQLNQDFRAGNFDLDRQEKTILHYQLGRAFLANNLIEQANEQFIQCESLLPTDDIPSWLQLRIKDGVVRNRQNEHRIALDSYSWLLELLADDPIVIFKQGNLDMLWITLYLGHVTSSLGMGKDYLQDIRENLENVMERLNTWIRSEAPDSIESDIPGLLTVNEVLHTHHSTAKIRESLYLLLYDQLIWQFSEYLMWENRFIGGNESLVELAVTNSELGRAAESLVVGLPKVATAMPIQRAHFSQSPIMYQMIANGAMSLFERGSEIALTDAELALNWAESAAQRLSPGALRPEFWMVQTRLRLELQMWRIVEAADANQSDFQSLTLELFLKMSALASKVQAILQALPLDVEQAHSVADHTLLLGEMLYFMDDSHAQEMLQQAHALYSQEPPLGNTLYQQYTEQWLARNAQKDAP